jgi:hypothetical protein
MSDIQILTALHVWIGIRPNGDERILTVPTPDGDTFQMLAGDRPMIESLRPVAEKILHASRRNPGPLGPLARIELRTYRAVTS